ncbi:MAG: response regulator [Bryobacterales bacterium]|nr:response regulator [Bryobacterales bacterium]
MTPRKLKFVLAEDNPGDVFLIRRAFDLEGFSYELLVAKDGEEAMRYVQEAAAGTRVIDLILLDLNLPRYDGSEVLATLRRQPFLAAVPAVILTSSNSQQDRERCLSLGANHYFQKPSNLAAFMEIGRIAKELVETRLA